MKNGLNALAQRAIRSLGRTAAGPAVEERAPLCADPEDAYRPAGRDLIATVLGPWLNRNLATPFELLHRPDLAEKLERSGVELQHAIQKVAVPAALARGVSVHEIVRDLQRLTDRVMGRLQTDRRGGRLPVAAVGNFADRCASLVDAPDGAYLLGCGLASALAPAETWEAKLGLLLDIAGVAPADEAMRSFAHSVIEALLQELLRSPGAINEMLGPDLELGQSVLGFTAIAHGEAVGMVIQAYPALAPRQPTLSAGAQRLAAAIDAGWFEATRVALSEQILEMFKRRRRLSPDDAQGELDLLRMLAVCLTAAGGGFMPAEDVRAAVVERSRLLVEPTFLTALLSGVDSPAAEFSAVIGVLENVAGDANRRRAVRWLENTLSTRGLEDRWEGDPEARLAELAGFHRRIARAGAEVAGVQQVLESLGELGGRIEATHRLVEGTVDGLLRRERKIEWLERMACAETAPPGPAVEEAAAALRKFA